ncbi:tyrosine-type recombinase/integrase [Neoaquamicrobium sediminum]|nr:tyrosine-type recombinase/integrase [Mesorhizobium sediminum]
MVMRLLPALGRDPKLYDAGLIRQAILDEAQRSSPAYLKTMTMALRGYLRYLAARGLCQPGLDQAIPAVPQWRLSALPRYISTAEVDRVIASCEVTTPRGIRDRAILLLLARLGLRAGDVRDMRLDDINWREGTLRVRGKGRREIRLPLPQAAGDAIIDYLREARPHAACEQIFLRTVAPHQPLASSSVSSIVRLALERAGIDDAPSRGANLLRHSAATGMLRAGATLDTIGTVLRHRSVDTTAHYAKVDVNMLLQIAQPWPGSASC